MAIKSVDGLVAINEARQVLPDTILRALDSQLPLQEILELCNGIAEHESIARKCRPIWRMTEDCLLSLRVEIPMREITQSA